MGEQDAADRVPGSAEASGLAAVVVFGSVAHVLDIPVEAAPQLPDVGAEVGSHAVVAQRVPIGGVGAARWAVAAVALLPPLATCALRESPWC